MKTLEDWNCNVNVSARSSLTVGQTFAITCNGNTSLESEGKILIFPNNDKVEYDLVALEKQIQNPNKIFIKATSWKTGHKDYSDYTLVIGEQVIEIKGPKFQVKSVLESNSEMNLPPGAILPLFPLYAQILIGVGVITIITVIFTWFYRNKKYDRALIKLHSFKTSLSPYNELNKKLRTLDVEISKLDDIARGGLYLPIWTEQLAQGLMEYLSLTLQEPLFYYESQAKKNHIIKKGFKKRKVSAEVYEKYQDLRVEVNALIKSAQTAMESDSTQLIRDLSTTIGLCREFVDHLQNQLESRDA